MNDAIGIIEMFGFVTAITAADAAAKEYGKVSLMASDVCMQLPYTIKEILK